MLVKKKDGYYWYIQPAISNFSKEKLAYYDSNIKVFKSRKEGDVSYIRVIPNSTLTLVYHTSLCVVFKAAYKPGKFGLLWDDSKNNLCLIRVLYEGSVFYIFGESKKDIV